ncbi:MAG: hypothetical protein ACPGO5_00190 [Patescibacteria group bacterium]
MKLNILFFLMLLTGLISAQSPKVNKPYAGIMFAGTFAQPDDTLGYSNYASMRLAGESTFAPLKPLSFTAQIAVLGEFDRDFAPGVISNVYVKYQWLADFYAGKLAQIPAFLFRPSPYTSGSQFEPPSKAQLGIGGNPGFKILRNIPVLGSVQYGMFHSSSANQWSHDLGIERKLSDWTVTIAGSVLDTTTTGGFRLQKEDELDLFVGYNNDGFISYLTEVIFPWGAPYVDVVADYNLDRIQVIECGITQNYKHNFYQILVGCGVRSQHNSALSRHDLSFNMYLYVRTK